MRNDHRHTHRGRDTATLGLTPMTVDTAAAHPTSVRRTHTVLQRPRRLISLPFS